MKFVGIRCLGDDPPCRLSGLVALTAQLIETVPLRAATIDGFTDCRGLPHDAAEGLAQLERVAAELHARDAAVSRWYRWLRRDGPTNMAVEFDLTGSLGPVVAAFAPYSIHAELRNGHGSVGLA